MIYPPIFMMILGIPSGCFFFFLMSTLKYFLLNLNYTTMQISAICMGSIFYGLKVFIALILKDIKIYRPLIVKYYNRNLLITMYCQIIIAILLVLLTLKSFIFLNIFIMSFFIACRDVTSDAYRIFFIRAKYNIVFCHIGFRGGMILSGSIALLIAEFFNWNTAMLFLSILQILCTFIMFFVYPKIKNIETTNEEEGCTQEVAPSSQNKKLNIAQKTYKLITHNLKYLLHSFTQLSTKSILFLFFYKMNESSLHGSLDLYWSKLNIPLNQIAIFIKTIPLLMGIIGASIVNKFIQKYSFKQSVLSAIVMEIFIIILFLINNNIKVNIYLLLFTVCLHGVVSGFHSVTTVIYKSHIINNKDILQQTAIISSISSMARFVWGCVAIAISGFASWNFLFILLLCSSFVLIYLYKKNILANKNF